MKTLPKNNLSTLFQQLADEAQVYVPAQKDGQSGFYKWSEIEPDQLRLDVLNVYTSPKSVLLPQTEKMYNFVDEGITVNIGEVFEVKDKSIVFGLRPCDMKAIECLDQVFLTRTFVDQYYKSRRDNTVFIANACYKPGKNCFCSSMGVNPTEPSYADVIIRDCGDSYAWEPLTDAGNQLTAKIDKVLAEASPSLPAAESFNIQVDIDGIADKLKDMFEHPLWLERAEPCQNCGICTYICPSCYCFDIQVKNFGGEGYRFRCWDSCMYREYALMAGGHNPRESGMERFRNRFLHKLEFFTERYGDSLCTGCGRCLIACPVGINITEIITQVKEAEKSA